jgi:dethiobiotin synthetase
MKTFFMAGTNTEVGKTEISCGLLHALGNKGYSSLAIKPIAAGVLSGGQCNDDALKLQKSMSLELTYEEINPVLFKSPIAPHIAAEREGVELCVQHLVNHVKKIKNKYDDADYCLIEGAGGWHTPLGIDCFLSDVPVQLNTPVILVVDMTLGCLNHAILTSQAIKQSGLELHSWVANSPRESKMDAYEENVSSLKKILPAPCLAEIPFCKDRSEWADIFDLALI